MARVKLEIDKAEFQKVVMDLEATQTFINPSALWKAVEQTEWAKSQQPKPLSAAVAYQRAREFGTIYKTKGGHRGNPTLGSTPRGPRTPRSQKLKKFAKTFSLLRNIVPERFLPMVDKMEKGSMKMAVKLKCLDCTNYQPLEIKLCTCEACSLYPHRPYQGKEV